MIAAAAAISVPSLGGAQRPDTRTMTCAAAAALVKDQGAIKLTTGANTYARLVSLRRYCEMNEVTIRHFAQTSDNPRCNVGYICKGRARPGG